MPRGSVRHVCAGGVIVRQEAGHDEVCLILRDRHGSRTWNLPKGHTEPGETVSETAMREVREETGLTGQILLTLSPIHYQFSRPGDPATSAKTVHFFLMRWREGDPSRHDDEVLEARWMPFDEAAALLTYENERHVLQEARHVLATQ